MGFRFCVGLLRVWVGYCGLLVCVNLLSGGGFSVGVVVDAEVWFVGLDGCCFAWCLVLWAIALVVIGFGFVCCLWVVCYGACVVVVCWFCLCLDWLVDGCEYLRLRWCFLLHCWFGGLCCCGYFRLIVLLLCGSLLLVWFISSYLFVSC